MCGHPPPRRLTYTGVQCRTKSPRPASVNFQHVDQRVTLVTLGVSDYARAKAFYAALGWRPALEVEETAFFQCNQIVLALWGREKLGPDLGITDDGARWSGMSLAQNVRSQEEVHAVIEHARENGAQITREPSDTFYGGYAGAFRDLDGHAWEIAHNPGFGFDDDGNIVLPGA
jgi:predicted lactoylglutathione lyase